MTCLTKQEQLDEIRSFLAETKYPVAVDTETNITDRYHERYLLGISIASGEHSWYIPVGHEHPLGGSYECLTPPSDLFNRVQPELVFHNAKFDIHVLKRAGIHINYENFYDTMLMSHLISEDHIEGHSLNACAARYLGKQSKKENEIASITKKFGWVQIPPSVMAKYAEQDVKLTLDLYLRLKPLFEEYEEYWVKERKFLITLQQLEEKGLRVDIDEAERLEQLCVDRIAKIDSELGFNPKKKKELHEKLFSAPPVGYGLKPLSFTAKTNQPQVNTSFLEKTNHPVCGLLLERSEIEKQVTSYYRPYVKLAGRDYGRIHASFKQHGTVTGRLSCADPNMQQIPRDSPIKKLFLPEPGKQLWEIDYKNIEMRLAACYSKEPVLYNTFRDEGDVHQATAELLGISRQHAKTINFLVIYGGGAGVLAKQLNIPFNRAQTLLNQYREMYAQLFHTAKAAENAVYKNGGWVKMWSGRRRHFRFKNDYHKAFNAIVQGGSFEIVKTAMLDLQWQGFDIRNQVHDSVWLMVDNEEQVKQAESIMSDWTEELFGLRFSVESKQLA